MSTLPRGVCPVCGQERQLTKIGVMRHHKTPAKDRWWATLTCTGSGKHPRSVAADPITAAEERGYARAIADLRARADQLVECDAVYAVSFADHLESIAPGETTP